MTELADGLAYLHGINVVHSDIRVVSTTINLRSDSSQYPRNQANVLVDSHKRVRIGDFGKSGFYGSSASSSRPQVTGAVGHLAPELLDPDGFGLQGDPRPTFMADIYSYGSTCYEVRDFLGEGGNN